MYISFGDRLVLLRKRKKFSQEHLAKKVGIAIGELVKYENDSDFPPLNIAVKIANVLDTSLDFLACRVDEQPSLKLLKWSGEIENLSERTKEVLFETLDALVGYDKVKDIYNKY